MWNPLGGLLDWDVLSRSHSGGSRELTVAYPRVRNTALNPQLFCVSPQLELEPASAVSSGTLSCFNFAENGMQVPAAMGTFLCTSVGKGFS